MKCICDKVTTCMGSLSEKYSLDELLVAFSNLQINNPNSSVTTWTLEYFINKVSDDMRSKTLSSSGELLFGKFVIELTNLNK